MEVPCQGVARVDVAPAHRHKRKYNDENNPNLSRSIHRRPMPCINKARKCDNLSFVVEALVDVIMEVRGGMISGDQRGDNDA